MGPRGKERRLGVRTEGTPRDPERTAQYHHEPPHICHHNTVMHTVFRPEHVVTHVRMSWLSTSRRGA